VTIVGVVLLGLAVELAVGEVRPSAKAVVGGPRFEERALFCPPGLVDGKSFAVAAPAEDRVSLGLEPARPDRVQLDPGHIFIQELPGSAATDVVGYGGPVRAGALVRTQEPIVGEAAARCSDRASSHWFFASGASTLGVDERLMLYNPFPDEAVVRVTFLTETGEERKGGLADIPVPSKSSTEIRVENFIALERTLAVRIDTKRGRVVAWRMLFDNPEGGPTGVQMSLGATATSDTWFFPDGAVGPGVDERISIMNPGTEEARVNVSLTGDGELIQPEDLVGLEITPGTARTISLNDVLKGDQKDLGGVSAVVQSTNGVGIVAERSIRYNTSTVSGSAAEVGSPRTSTAWLVPAATLNPSTDTIVVMNPGSTPAEVSLELLFDRRAPLSPEAIQSREVPPGGRLKIGVGQWTELATAMIRVESTAPVVVERFSYSAVPDDVAAVMGFPLE
jgi:hypothetical protein